MRVSRTPTNRANGTFEAGENFYYQTDSLGSATSVIDALTNATTFEVDAGDRVTKHVDALLNERLFGYDAEDNLTSVTDARTNITGFAYDLFNRATGRTNPLMESASFTYDSRSNLETATDPKTQVTTNTHDALNRLTQVSTLDNLITLAYDPVGSLTSVTDDDSDLAFTYDGLNRVLTASTGPGGVQALVVLTSSYDAVSNRISLADDAGVSGAVTGFAHDGAGRLTQLTTPASQPIDLAYDLAGRITGLTFPNTVSSTLQYDLATGRLSQLTHSAGATPLADFSYGYNGVGNIASIAELSQTRNFTYDDLQRLTAGGTTAAPESYSYDPEGNRTSSHLSAGHATDIANRLTEDDAFCYAYDANGNLTSKTAKVAGACTGGVTTYTYDVQGQLTRIDFSDLTFAAYRYDGLGRRIEKDVNGTVTKYVYDGDAILLEYDGLENLLARYSHGQGVDRPLAVSRDLDSSGTFEAGEQFYYQADHQGSLRKVTDNAGLVVNSYDYDSYGNIEASFEGIPNAFTYTGREFDAESGFYFYRTRSYDPVTGRFLSEDLLDFGGGDANLYRYVLNNPLGLVDPFGLLTDQEVANIIFNETRSLSGPRIGEARRNIGNAILNGDAARGAKRPMTAPTTAIVPPAEQAIYNQCLTAAQQAKKDQAAGTDPTNGAMNFNFRNGNSRAPFFGLPIQTQVGPLNNSFPTSTLGSTNIYSNTYGGQTSP